MTQVIVLGAGGHAKVVADILLASGYLVRGYLDDNPVTWGQQQLGLPVLGGINDHAEYEVDGLVIGIGDNAVRRRIAERLGHLASDNWCNAIHPSAVVASSVCLGHGAVIAAGAVINPDSVIGDHVIINTGATVDHDCVVGDYSHIAPGVHLAGNVTVGTGALLGVGVSVIPGCSIGQGAIIGAGAVVVDDIPDKVVAKGVPARW